MSTLTEQQTTTSGPPPRSAKRWWVLGGLGVVGLAAALTWAVIAALGLVEHVEDRARSSATGPVTVPVTEPGEHTVYYERTGWVRRGGVAPQTDVHVTGPAGEPVATSSAPSWLQYRVPGRHGHPVATFEAPQAGDYEVAVEGEVAEGAELAVAGGSPGRMLWPIASAAALVLASAGVLVAAAIALFLHRGRRGPSDA